jgi:hypothetical protein
MDAIGEFIAGIESGAVPRDVFCEDAVLDATVPNWRFTARSGEAIWAELGRWFADPGHFEDLHRSRLPDGELVEFTLTWQEGGVRHMCHQAHILRMRDGRIAGDTAFCGGRWAAPLIAEMAAAAQSTDR